MNNVFSAAGGTKGLRERDRDGVGAAEEFCTELSTILELSSESDPK